MNIIKVILQKNRHINAVTIPDRGEGDGMIGGVKGGWGGFGEVTAPPLCNLTHMTLIKEVHTETNLHR